ncbi:helix-turn-helix domain-containing protein [Flavobacterium sp. WC2421]|jgi:AraC family transcriptional regulator, transcriptional activator of pobA|uniref:Helix-turn-helix domain-containing protein n=3 Tax=unclassified Flavobacterium TaxID=196869 RepID=A0AB39WE12_9FLAO
MNNKYSTRKLQVKITERVKTYSQQGFRDRFLENDIAKDFLFKSKSEQFFCLKLEEINQLKFPVPPSKHISHTLLFIISGTHKIKIGFEEYTTQSNEIIVVPAGQIFSIESIPIDLKGFICQFHPDILIGKYGNLEMINDFNFLKIGGNPKPCFPDKESQFILQLLHRLQIEYTESGITNLDILQPYLIALLCEINKNALKAAKKGTAATVLTSKFKELIYANINQQHQVDYYASILNVSPNHLNKSIKSVTDKSPTKWIEETILLEAKYLLYQTNLSISEIAMRVGHYDQSYFSRIFKKNEGISPIQFRKRIDKS